MTSEVLGALLGVEPAVALATALVNINVAGALAVGIVALAHPLTRRRLGPETACSIWTFVLLVSLSFGVIRHAEVASGHRAPMFTPSPQLDLALVVWAVGALALAFSFAWAQFRFMREIRGGRAGPAVVGLISPRIIMPADGYTPEERELIRAHEREHVGRKDPRAAALAAVFQCLCWFNPFVHLAARLLRVDQELSCDAAVVRSRPTARALYARTLLKTQLAATPLPFGCYFGAHPLEVRVEMLKRKAGKRPVTSSGATIVQASGEAIRP
jgi:beta-lactamase regulating signal transducer with metallopeptidase domain